MDFNKTISLIESRMPGLENEKINIEKEISYLSDLLDNMCFASIDKLCKCDTFKLMMASIIVDTNEEYEYVAELLVDSNILDSDVKRDASRIIERYITNKDTSEISKSIKEVGLSNIGFDIDAIKRLLQINNDGVIFAFQLFSELEELKIQYEITKNIVDSTPLLQVMYTKKQQKKGIEEVFNELDYPKFRNKLYELQNRMKNYYKSYISKRGKINNKMNKLRELSIKLSVIKSINAYEIESLLSLCVDDDVKLAFLVELEEYLNSKKKSLEVKKNSLNGKTSSEIYQLFIDYGYDFNKLTKEAKEKVSLIDDISSFLELTKKIGITDIEDINYAIINSSLTTLKDIYTNINNSVLSSSYIKENIDFISTSAYEKTKAFIDMFNELRINPMLFHDFNDIYLCDQNVLLENLEILSNYNLLTSLKTTNTYEMLLLPDLEVKIDTLLECGYEDIIVKNLNILNYDYSKIKRLLVLKSLDELPTNVEALFGILNTSDFIIPDEEIDEYIPEVSNYYIDEEVLSKLNNKTKYTKDNIRTIRVGNKLISKNKIVRNLKLLEGLDISESDKEFYSIIYGTILSYKEIDEIKNILTKGDMTSNKRRI